MKQDPKDPKTIRQPEDGTNQDLNLTNDDASLVNNDRTQQPDAPLMTDAGSEPANDNMKGTAIGGDNLNPEYGDSEDPTLEAL